MSSAAWRAVSANGWRRKTRANSWIVNKDTGEPTGYLDSEKHPALHHTAQVITTGEELRDLLKRCAADRE